MKRFTAHIRDSKFGIERQTVEEHSRNVANLSMKYAKGISLSSLVQLQGLLHDAGKLCEDFDDYINACAEGQSHFVRGSIDHSFAGAKYLLQHVGKTETTTENEVIQVIARTILSHHGLHDWIDAQGDDYLTARTEKSDRYDEISKNIKERLPECRIEKLLQDAVGEYSQIQRKIVALGKNGCDNAVDRDRKRYMTLIPFYYGMFERVLESILVDADRTDTSGFQWNRDVEFQTKPNLWDRPLEEIEKQYLRFQRKKDSISVLRCDISERCKKYAASEHGICRMVVPTGGGKTLSSLRFALHYCKEHQKERIFYIAPFMSILEQNSDVWKEIVGEENFLEHHSNMMAKIQSEEELSEYELRSEKWDRPVIATTLVQFLNALFSGKMDCVRRMHRLCNSVIIIDEVQGVPAKCVNLFNLAINFLAEIGNSCIVLCSATQPVFDKTEYKLLLDRNESSMTGNYEQDFQLLKRSSLVPELTDGGYSYDQAARYCCQKLEENRSVLFIVNTKRAALELFEKMKNYIEDGVRLFHLSTYLCPESRRQKIREMKQYLASGKPMVCITTQLIEAGVDVSFPCVIRSVAGLDNAVQAAGRCNRNGEWEKCCDVFLINLKDEKIQRLKEISWAQKITKEMIRNKNIPDLLKVDAMQLYYKKYYQMRKNELSYAVEDLGVKTDLLDLLSRNSVRWNYKKNRDRSRLFHAQALKTAGKLFQVIDEQTVPVIVPFDEEAIALISSMRSHPSAWEQVQLIRKAQKFMIEIYPDTEKRLVEMCAIEKLPCDIYALQDAFYDPDIGICMERKELELLCY